MPGPEAARPVLDTVVLRVMAFAHPAGIDILLDALAFSSVCFPAEVYNRDENALPLSDDDRDLSELARGLRFARRQVMVRPLAESQRYQQWLRNAVQIAPHLAQGSLRVDPLSVEELPDRERLRQQYGIGRGEAAGLVLAGRHGARAIFLSSDELACRVARVLAISYLTMADLLVAWADRRRPRAAEVDALVEGLQAARFGLKPEFVRALREPRP